MKHCGRIRRFDILASAFASAFVVAPLLGRTALAASMPVFTGAVVVQTDGRCSLREAIDNANSNSQSHVDCPKGDGLDVISLPAAIYDITVGTLPGPEDGLPTILSPIEIVSQGPNDALPGPVLDGGDAVRHFTVALTGSLTLRELTLTNGRVTSNGGSVLNEGQLATDEVLFESNRAERGGAVHSTGTATITESLLRDNRAEERGGAASNTGTFELVATTLEDNRARLIGGALWNDVGGRLVVGNCDLSGNVAGQGGAIGSNGELEVDSSDLTGNFGTGGALYNVHTGVARVTDSNLSSNDADTPGGSFSGTGGAIRNFGMLELDGCTVHGNESIQGGGGIETWGSLVLANTTVSGNEAIGQAFDHDGGGGILILDGTVEIAASDITQNVALEGGGIANRGGTLAIADSTVVGNHANLFSGGGIYNEGGIVDVVRSVVSGNEAVELPPTNIDNAGGGGIFSFLGRLTLEESVVEANSSQDLGGGILVRGATAVAAIRESAVRGNGAVDRGGGIYAASGAEVTVSDSTVSGNTAPIGGGVWSAVQDFTIERSTLSGNTATTGGGIFNALILRIENGTLSENSATSEGGAIASQPGTDLRLTNATLVGNAAPVGAALSIAEHAILKNAVIGGSGGPNCSVAPGVVPTPDGLANLDDDLTCHAVSAGFLTAPQLLLAPLASYGGPTETHLPHPASPAVNAGDKPTCDAIVPNIDQRGLPRSSEQCDIGSVELGVKETFSPLFTDVSQTRLPAGLQTSLLSNLEAAEVSFDRGSLEASSNRLRAFANHVEAQRGKKIAETDASRWLRAIENMRALLGDGDDDDGRR